MIGTGKNMNSLKKNWILILAILAVVALVLFNLPRLQAWRLRAMAAEQIMRYVDLLETSSPDAVDGLFYCLLPLFHEEVQPPIALNDAIQWLEESQQLDPHNSHGDFLLGQAYCFAREYSQAIDELYIFVNQRNGNTLGMAELGFAHLVKYLDSQASGKYPADQYLANYYLTNTGFSNAFFQKAAEQAYRLRNISDALKWVELRKIFNGELSVTTSQQHLLDGFILLGEKSLKINYSEFFKITDGLPAPTMLANGVKVAVLPSNASDIGVIVRTDNSSRYCLSLVSVDQKPEPTQLALYLNFEEILRANLNDGDGNLESVNTDTFLERGSYLLSVKFLNDFHSTSGDDRNGYVESISIVPCQ